jgi:EpsI family protein
VNGRRDALRTFALAALVLLPVAVLSLRLSRPVAASAGSRMAEAVPHRIGPFEGEDVALRARTIELLETTDVVNRIYAPSDGSPYVSVCVVHSPDNRKIAHPPEVCYAGWGYEVVERSRTSLEGPDGLFDAAFLTVTKGTSRDSILYWYQTGSALGANYYREQLRAALAMVSGRPLGTSLVRLSTPETDGRDAARERLRSFATLLVPHLQAVPGPLPVPVR